MRRISLFLFLSFLNASYGMECDSLPNSLKLRELRFQVVEPTDRYVVRMMLPELKKAQCEQISFEYGTDYYFKLSTNQNVQIQYFKTGDLKPSRTTQMKRHLSVHSVMLAAERNKTPHYIEVKDDELNITYEIYLTANRGPSHVKRTGEDRRFKIISVF